jgi:hypothetical protein
VALLNDPMEIVQVVIGYAPIFREDFGPWLINNWAVWKAFERRATRLWDAGSRHAGARMIGETIRYLTALREQGSGKFKVNDHWWPDCARLWTLLNADRRGFFETRGNGSRKLRDQLELFE